MEDIGDLDTVWVVWPAHDLVVWSRERHEWINLLFELMNPDEEPAELPVLQDAGAGVLDPHRPCRAVALLLHGNLSLDDMHRAGLS
jgi:hypothetical protein